MNEMIERVAAAIDGASQPPGQKDYKIMMENAAKAAIEAMREPTQGVLDCRPPFMTVVDARAMWQTMIDAALS